MMNRVGDYRLEELVHGTFISSIYRATDARTGSSVALKVCGLAEDAALMGAQEVYMHELISPRAEVVASAGVVVAKEMFIDEFAGNQVLAFEYVSGTTLAKLMNCSLGRNTKAWRVHLAMNVGSSLCDALSSLHTRVYPSLMNGVSRILHCDLTPHNVLVGSDGNLKLIDLGAGVVESDYNAVKPETVCGSPEYMSPEHLSFESVDNRSDVWGVGAVMYEILTGKLPFGECGSPDSFSVRVREAEVNPPSKYNRAIPEEVDVVVLTALEKDPSRRWQSVEELKTAMSCMQLPAAPYVHKVELGKLARMLYHKFEPSFA